MIDSWDWLLIGRAHNMIISQLSLAPADGDTWCCCLVWRICFQLEAEADPEAQEIICGRKNKNHVRWREWEGMKTERRYKEMEW